MKAKLVLLGCTLLAAATGCGSSQPAAGTGDTGLQPPAIGMQLATSDTTLQPAEEKYACWSFTTATDAPIALVGLETQVSAGVHHYAIFTDSSSKANQSEAYDCEQMGATWGLVTGGGIGTPPVHFPDGTAMTIPAGSKLVVQLHLLNASSAPLTVGEQRFNLIGAPPSQTLKPVGLLIAGTLDITIPAHQSGVKVTGGCKTDLSLQNVFAVFPHMHRLGRRITTTIGPATISDISWNFKDQGLYDAKGSAQMGDQVTVECDYDNNTDHDVHFGLHSSDEMCINVLYYYPATVASQYCGIG